MRILWVATKSPVPTVDGGRLVALTTLQAITAAGHDVTVVAPVDPAAIGDTRRACHDAGISVELVAARPAPWPRAALRAIRQGLPVTIARHAHRAVRARVDALLESRGFDVVHAEQLHALAACDGTRAHHLPLVWRAQNVESEVWETRAKGERHSVGGRVVGTAARRLASVEARHLASIEARRLARYEAAAVRRTAATIALSVRDAERLATIAGDGARIRRIAAPFAGGGLAPGPALPGTPAVALPASAGWSPNEEAIAWFTRDVWPVVVARLPNAHLHLFGAHRSLATANATTLHPAPAASADVFPAGAIVVVPLRSAVGVRMRILEAWARGVPVVATPAAAAGLDPGAEHALAIAGSADTIAAKIARLAADPAARRRLVAAGGEFLRTHHDPATLAGALAAVYSEVSADVSGNDASAARART